MTTNSPNQPNPPQQQRGYNPITLEDVQNPAKSRTDLLFAELNTPLLRVLGIPLFGFIFLFSLGNPIVGPATILVLLGCFFSRLDDRPRQIAAAPLTLAAINLVFQMSAQFSFSRLSARFMTNVLGDGGLSWLPMFFSICLVYISKRDSTTFKIILAGSGLLLMSGLLPGQGFLGIFYLLNHLLFVAITVGIVIDLKDHVFGEAQGSLRTAH